MHTKTVNGRTSAWDGDYDVNVKSDYRPRPLVSYAELTPEVAAEFDYMLPDNIDYATFRALVDAGANVFDTFTMPRFFKFRGEWYDSQEFTVNHGEFAALGWNAGQPQSYFDAVLIRYFDADGNLFDYGDSVVIGYAHW